MAAPGGLDTRVVDAQRQAAASLRLTVGFVVLAALSAATEIGTGDWLALHLFLVGGLLTAIAGATQLLAVTWSASPAPSDRAASLQRWLLAVGAVAVALGREWLGSAVAAVGGVAVAAALVVLGANLLGVRRTGRNRRFRPAIDAYLLALGWAGVGIVLGIAMVVATPGRWSAPVRDAHVAVNVFGLVGSVIVGTLPFFVATQARMKMAPAATDRAMYRVFLGLHASLVVIVAGHGLETPAVAAAGYLAHAVGLMTVVTLVPRPGRRQIDWAGPRLLQLGAGCAWWVAMTVLLGLVEVSDVFTSGQVLRALAVGGFAQILVASLAYLGPVIRAGGHERLAAGFATTRSVPSLVLGNVAAVAVLFGAGRIAVAALVLWAADVVTRAVRLSVRT